MSYTPHNIDNRSHKRIPMLGLIALLLLIGCSQISAIAKTPGDDMRVSFSLNKTPFTEIVKMIHEQTGYTVLLDDSLERIKISGEYRSIKLERFLLRTLKGGNSFFIISDKEKTIVVRTATAGASTHKPVKNIKKHLYQAETSSDVNILDRLNKTKKSNKSYSQEAYGGIDELDNIFPSQNSGNKKHLIDTQTGNKWEEEEKSLQQE